MTANHDLTLAPFRARLDAVDDQLARIVSERLAICAEVARTKRTLGIPMMQPDRVGKVCDAYAERGRMSNVDPKFMRALAELIIAEACRLEDEIIDQP